MTEKNNIEAVYPLSPMQQGILFHSLRDPESGQYFIQVSSTLRSEIDADAFERAWQQVAARHSILRTAFVWKNLDRMLQVVGRTVKVPFTNHDWRHLSTDEQQQRLASLLAEDRQRGFDLSHAPLMRLGLIRLGEDRYQFLWSYHHLILDGWSMPIVFREIMAHYNALRRGESVQLPPAPPYRQYIDWLQRQDITKAERFWREYLRGFNAATKLPADRAPSVDAPGRPGDYAEQLIQLSEETTLALQSVTRHYQVTLNTLAQGTWALLLHSYAGEPEVVFGCTVAGRPVEIENIEAMVGLLINTLPLRVRIAPGEMLASYLRRLQQQQSEAQQYDYTPLVNIHGWSEVPRRVPLFESLLVFENYPVASALKGSTRHSGRFAVEHVQGIERLNYPLAFVLSPASGMMVKAIYDRRQFSDLCVKRILSHWETLLSNIAAGAESRVGLLPFLAAEERSQLLTDWNATEAGYIVRGGLHEHVDEQARRTPDAVALAFEDQVMTYATLEARANQLANYLRRLNVGCETRVAICAERGFDLVIGLLAIIKAGGAYVPLDPEYPKEVLDYIIRDAHAPVLLADRNGLERLNNVDALIIHLEDDRPLFGNESEDAPEPVATEENLAYVIYTSGSTGWPKGAMNTHRAIVNRLLWMQETYGLDSTDRILQKTPFSFDVSVWEFFWPLMSGACLVIAQPGGHRDPAYLVRTIVEQEVTTLHFVPSMLQEFLSEPDVARCNAVRRVICSGEALSADLARQFFTRLDSELHNLYGPTETAVDVTFWACARGDARSFVPIGRPIANTRTYVLSANGGLAPVGVPGQLHIGGMAVGRGYLNQPALSAGKFVPDEFSSEPGKRLYATGDVVRWLDDGTLEYLGRNDHQTKIRGVRIELGGIEAILATHTGVRQCAVIVREDKPGDKRLVAYIVPDESKLTTADLRSYLQERAANYITVSAFVMLEALPLTPNGKLDRKALLSMQDQGAAAESNGGAARRPVEEILAGIWEMVLHRENVGIHDNFFDLGGHSLLATQIVSRVRNALNADLPLRALFEAPTVAELAARIARAGKSLRAPQIPEALTALPDDAQQLSFAQERMWFLEQFDSGSPAHQALFGLRLRGELDIDGLARATREVLRRHDVLRAYFGELDGEPVQRIAENQSHEQALVDLSACVAPEVIARELARALASQPFEISRGPLLRIMLLRLSRLGSCSSNDDASPRRRQHILPYLRA